MADVIDWATSCMLPFGLKNRSKDLPGVGANVLFAKICPVNSLPS